MTAITTDISFSSALEAAKKGKYITRLGWGKKIRVTIQFPDENSKMTEPYLYMIKEKDGIFKRFPLDLSCESILANDWIIF